jgi:hypothetical protein
MLRNTRRAFNRRRGEEEALTGDQEIMRQIGMNEGSSEEMRRFSQEIRRPGDHETIRTNKKFS